jgi:hypothetical protein
MDLAQIRATLQRKAAFLLICAVRDKHLLAPLVP